MIYRSTIISAIIILIVVLGLSFYKNATKDTHAGMSIIIEEQKEIPLFKGLKSRESDYVLNGDRVEEVYTFYKDEMLINNWQIDYMQLDEFNISDGFYSRWLKEGFEGEVIISSYFDKAENKTIVLFDHVIPPKTSVWFEKTPTELCVYEHQNVEGCIPISDSNKINDIIKYINELALDMKTYKHDGDYGILSAATENGVLNINIYYSKEKESIIFESSKGFKQMKPEKEFLEWTELTHLLND